MSVFSVPSCGGFQNRDNPSLVLLDLLDFGFLLLKLFNPAKADSTRLLGSGFLFMKMARFLDFQIFHSSVVIVRFETWLLAS
ncbi:hypothetical protein EUGRSUZ_H03690 [Eucalyptus grandis]|uniref:Uncharacterized protein n=2 Tax=Eucalyptus grandis TaxID=71139 RepID=A0ACC3JUW1_EUCGR|nr:hypothetical protein EUGRSUZ_H03690 [Eucalyptus grandis]